MKKLLFLALATTLTLVACSNKNNGASQDADTTVADTTATPELQADGLSDEQIAPDDLWTEDAVKADIQKMYARLNEMTEVIKLGTMDREFCTGHYLNVKQAIADYDSKNAKGDMRFYGDEEGFRWLTGLSLPLKIKEIKAELLTGNMARAFVKFENPDPDDEEFTGRMYLDLWMENGHWRVNNFDDPEAFGDGGYLGTMENYAREHNINIEEE